MDLPEIYGPCEGHIEPFENNMLRLWVWHEKQPDEAATVEITIGGRSIGLFKASEFRSDLLEAGKGTGFHALTVDLTAALNQCDSFSIVEIETYCLGDTREKFGELKFQWTSSYTFTITRKMAAQIRDVSEHGILNAFVTPNEFQPAIATISIEGRRAQVMVQPVHDTTPPKRHHQLSKYADFVRYRFRSDSRFQCDDTPADVDHYLKWYLEFYSVHRQGLRAPLSAGDIAYLNEAIIFGGQQHHLTRATWTFLVDNKSLVHSLDLNSADSYLGIVYWWSIERARSLYVEDCLVPSSYRSTLNEIRHIWRTQDFPLNRFLEVFFSRNTRWHFFSFKHHIVLCAKVQHEQYFTISVV